MAPTLSVITITWSAWPPAHASGQPHFQSAPNVECQTTNESQNNGSSKTKRKQCHWRRLHASWENRIPFKNLRSRIQDLIENKNHRDTTKFKSLKFVTCSLQIAFRGNASALQIIILKILILVTEILVRSSWAVAGSQCKLTSSHSASLV
jgi:hypothetical protein